MTNRIIERTIDISVAIDEGYDGVCGKDCPFLVHEECVDSDSQYYCALFGQYLENIYEIVAIRCSQCQTIFNPQEKK
jgi:hypothetical protein